MRRRNGEKSGVDTDEGKEPIELISEKMFSTDDEEREEAEGEAMRGGLE